MVSAQHIFISDMDSGTESMLIKPASVRERGHELHLERKNQENMILPGNVIVVYLKRKISCRSTTCEMNDYVQTKKKKLYQPICAKQLYDECNSTD